MDRQVYIAEGDVVISKQDTSLHAQRAVYDRMSGTAEVSGDVRIEIGKDTLRGEHGIFDLNKQTGRITNGSVFLSENHYYIQGKVLEKLEKDTYLVRECRVTTCDGVHPDWTITGSEVRVTVEGYGEVKHAAFRIRGLPILYVPYMLFPAKSKRQSGFLPLGLGYSSSNGFLTELPFFWAISDQTDATFYQQYMSNRGYMQGTEFRYLLDGDSKGIFLFDILPDDPEEKDLNDPDDVGISPFSRTNQTRYWLRGKSDQDFPFGLTARLDLDFVSDQDYLREFQQRPYGFDLRADLAEEFDRPVEERYSPTRRSALRLGADGETYSLQALSSYEEMPDAPVEDTTPQPLAALRFTELPRAMMNSSSFLLFDSNYDYIWREAGSNGHRIGMTPRFLFPLWIGPLGFEPSFRYDLIGQWYDQFQEGADRQWKTAYEAKGRLSSNVERTYDLKWRDMTRVKHRIWPSLTYQYRVLQDRDKLSPWFEPTDQEGDLNRLILSLENFLDARLEPGNESVVYRQWATFTLSQGYDLGEARSNNAKKQPFEPLTALFIVRPLHYIDIFSKAAWDHYEGEFAFAEVSLELSAPRPERVHRGSDVFRIDYRYEKDLESLSVSLDTYLAYGFSVGGSLDRDLSLKEDVTSTFWLGYERQCWGVRFGARKSDEITTFVMSFDLRGLGEVKPF